MEAEYTIIIPVSQISILSCNEGGKSITKIYMYNNFVSDLHNTVQCMKGISKSLDNDNFPLLNQFVAGEIICEIKLIVALSMLESLHKV